MANNEDFNQATKKQQEQVATTEKSKSVASQVQIEELELTRPTKEYKQEYTPQGSITKQVNQAEFERKNTEISSKQANFRARMQAQKGKAKEAFERSNAKSKGREI